MTDVLSRFRLDGRVALVTGGARGIGHAAAVAFAGAGADVAITYRERAADAAGVVAEIEALSRRGVAIQVEVADEAGVARMLDEVESFAGERGLGILLNNAGIYPTGSLDTISFEDWRRVIDVNVHGPFLVTKAALPLLRRAGTARVIMISSVLPLKGVPDALHYSTAKMAIIGFTRSLARELGPDGITVNCLVPSMVSTETANTLLPDAIEQVVADQAIRRYEQPDDLVGALLFLASDASAMTTGQTILAEGGRVFV